MIDERADLLMELLDAKRAKIFGGIKEEGFNIAVETVHEWIYMRIKPAVKPSESMLLGDEPCAPDAS